MASHCKSLFSSSDECRPSVRWLPTLDQANLGCESTDRLLLSSLINIILLLLFNQIWYSFYCPVESRKRSWPGQHSPYPSLYITVADEITNEMPVVRFKPWIAHMTLGMLLLDYCNRDKMFDEHTWPLQDHSWQQHGQFSVHVNGPLPHCVSCHCLLAQIHVAARSDQTAPLMPWSVVMRQLHKIPQNPSLQLLSKSHNDIWHMSSIAVHQHSHYIISILQHRNRPKCCANLLI